MKKILLDLNPMTSIEKVQEYLKFELEFPDYYGENLDALYDELTSIRQDTCIALFYSPEDIRGMYDYIHKVKKVFQDAELENEHLLVVFCDLIDNYPEN